jgi:acyl carrier protein
MMVGLSDKGPMYIPPKTPIFIHQYQMMDKENVTLAAFVQQLEAQFEGLEPGTLHGDLEFRQLPEWTSMQSLIVIASFDWDYGVTVSADELRTASTIADLYHLVLAKMA